MKSDANVVPTVLLKQIAIVNAALTNMEGARFLIVLPDGTSFGNNLVEAKPTTTKRRVSRHKRGTFSSIYRTLISDNAKVGDVITIKVPDGMCVETMRSSAQHYAAKLWGGGGACISYVNHDKHHVELLRSA